MRKRSIENSILQYWYHNTIEPKPSVFFNVKYKIYACLLVVPAILYNVTISLRRFLYKTAVFKSFRLDVPVIIVGNLCVGGTGKTPVVIALAEILKQNGFNPGIIIRGYARQADNNHSILVTDDTVIDNIGDEAKLIYNRLKLPVAVGANRVDSARLLLSNTDCNIIISDDGMQHYRLQRDIEICVVDNLRKFGNGKLLPAGPLREGIKRLNDVDYILSKNINESKCDNYLVQLWFNQYGGYVNNNIFSVDIHPVCFVDVFTDKEYSLAFFLDYLATLKDFIVYAVSGIGNNKSFFGCLNELGVNELNIVDLPDHYAYESVEDFNRLFKHNTAKKIILTTEKDAVKIIKLKEVCNDNIEIYSLRVEMKFSPIFINNILAKINALPIKHKLITNIKEEIAC